LIKRAKYKYFLSNKKSPINREDLRYYLHSKNSLISDLEKTIK